MKKIIIAAVASSILGTAAFAAVSADGTSRIVEVIAASIERVTLDADVQTTNVAATDRVEQSRVQRPGTFDTAAWSAWVLGTASAQVTTPGEVQSGEATVVVTGGEAMTETVAEGDYDVVYAWTSEEVTTTTTPQFRIDSISASTRTDTRSCEVTVNGEVDAVAPTCDPAAE